MSRYYDHAGDEIDWRDVCPEEGPPEPPARGMHRPRSRVLQRVLDDDGRDGAGYEWGAR